MEAGRSLDALVAEKVMGLDVQNGQVVTVVKSAGYRIDLHPVPPYSTSIADAWLVVEKVMQAYRGKVSIETYDAEIWSIKPCGTSSKSLPHAICLAALKAVGA